MDRRSATHNWPLDRRPTIGLFLDRIDEPLYQAGWLGLNDAVRQRGANPIFFLGAALRDKRGFAAQGNVLYDLVDAGRIDGLIVWSSGLDWYIQPQEIDEFCRRFHPLPLVSIGRALVGIPSVVVDNYQGMREAVTHLIVAHGYRHIACLRGAEGSDEEALRFRAYTDVLAEHGLPLLPALVSPHSNWQRTDGAEAIRLLLDERKLVPRVDLEAVVATNDRLACGAMEALQARGIQVPGEVAVVGFDDDDEGRTTTPSLTTVGQPIERLGREAVDALLALLRGDPAPQQVMVPLRMIVRQSCGCLDPAVAQARAEWGAALASPAVRQADIVEELVDSAGEGTLSPEQAKQLLDTFAADVAGEAPGAFLRTCHEILQPVIAGGGNVAAWHGMLSVLRRRLLPGLAGNQSALWNAENLCQQARVLIGETARQVQVYRTWRMAREVQSLHEIGQAFSTTTGVAELMDLAASQLPALGIPSCYLALYEDPREPTSWARLILAYNESGPIALEEGRRRFPSRWLLPDELWPRQRPCSLVLEPLYFREEQLGFVLFEVGPRLGAVYHVLRGQISSALKQVMLYQEAVEVRRAAEQARQAAEEANNLKSHFLSMVSHELRTPLNLIVGLSEMALWEQARVCDGDSDRLVETLRHYHEQIYASAQHLDRLIRDVLDLGSSQLGQLKLACAPLDIGDLLREIVPMGRQMAQAKQLTWKDEIPADLPYIWGDRTRMRQIILNLLSNAVKFTPQGQITLQAELRGDEITITICDTGLGIPPEEQSIIFDEFRQSSRSAARGYGGMGLGLAIARRLVEMHGGRIGVASGGEEGQGSAFYFTLPVMPGTASCQTGQELHREQPPQTVLLVTQEPRGNAPLREYLVERGFAVAELVLNTPYDGVSRIIEIGPGAVVLDCSPESDLGWGIVQMLKEHPATRDIPVLFYSLLQEQGTGSVLALNYLSKPARAEELAQALQCCGLGERPADSAKTILVVDDEPATLEMQARMVQAQLPGCRVLTAGDGRRALEMARRESLDLVLLDLMMPDLDGFAVLRALRECERTRCIPVIVLTAQTLSEQDMSRLNQGVAAVLGKGLFSADETLARVEAVLARNKRLGSETQRLVRRAMAYIHAHSAEPISRADIAQHVGMDEDYLTRCFDREVGVSPITYLSRYRIKRARELLETTDMSITEVALEAGFSSPSHFSNVFRNQVGISPSAYRQGKRR